MCTKRKTKPIEKTEAAVTKMRRGPLEQQHEEKETWEEKFFVPPYQKVEDGGKNKRAASYGCGQLP